MILPLLVFTDLDGTFLSEGGEDYQEALPGFKLLRRKRIPVVFLTGRTFPETEKFVRSLSPKSPFSVENGGALYFPQDLDLAGTEGLPLRGRYRKMVLSQGVEGCSEFLSEFSKEAGVEIFSFRDFSSQGLSEATGLPLAKAALAQEREFDLPFFPPSLPEPLLKEFLARIQGEGLTLHRGARFWSLSRGCSKGLALETVRRLYIRKYDSMVPFTIALGDGDDDFSFLQIADYKVLIRREGYDSEGLASHLFGCRVSESLGAKGWSEEVHRFFELFKGW